SSGCFFFSSSRRHTRSKRDWSSDVCSSDLSDIERAWVTPANPPGTQVHAPTVLATSTGLVAAWFAGAKEGSEDTRIYVSRCLGGEWTTPEVVAPAPTAHWNPVLAYAPDEQLWLFFKRGPEISSWVTWF